MCLSRLSGCWTETMSDVLPTEWRYTCKKLPIFSCHPLHPLSCNNQKANRSHLADPSNTDDVARQFVQSNVCSNFWNLQERTEKASTHLLQLQSTSPPINATLPTHTHTPTPGCHFCSPVCWNSRSCPAASSLCPSSSSSATLTTVFPLAWPSSSFRKAWGTWVKGNWASTTGKI